MPSLAEISRICGVSLGATSKALSGKPGVSDATRQRILSVASKYNYRPNRLVHAIQSGRSMTVGLTCNDFRSDFPGRIIEGMLEVLYGADYDAIVISWDLCVRGGEQVLQTFAERRVDGLLMFPPADQPSQAYLQELRNFRRPIVVVDQTFAGCEGFDFVGSQDFEGGVLATEHLLSLGHRRIANICHRKTSTGRARLEGFQHAMARHGVTVYEKWIREIVHYGSDEPLSLARELLAGGGGERPTAILCFNDWVALDAMAAAQDAGLRVPADVSVVGFADLRASTSVRPRLTTVAQDPVEIGRRAATRLLGLLGVSGGSGGAGDDGPRINAKAVVAGTPRQPLMDRVPVRLEVRESTGRAG
ncbi:LacI family DNA-binding transcriptional regulator [Geminisphaera colitermitum]|uniref:LacI family DNA-binding transcriptional regulator n=1 Tax=Geminisphaera colitermitum TaxID=1148786 RepID=UPI000158C9E7|nr:LacI family DNA-binding transcriptional regulator [Geminisphaera colitermitum]